MPNEKYEYYRANFSLESEKLHTDFKIKCAHKKRDMSDVISVLMRGFIEDKYKLWKRQTR